MLGRSFTWDITFFGVNLPAAENVEMIQQSCEQQNQNNELKDLKSSVVFQSWVIIVKITDECSFKGTCSSCIHLKQRIYYCTPKQ